MDNLNKPNNHFPRSNEECLKEFEQAESDGVAINEAQKNFKNNLKIQYKHQQSTIPVPPMSGAEGVRSINYPNKQLTLKLQ